MSQQLSGFFIDEEHIEITFNQEFSQNNKMVSGLEDLDSNEYKILASIDNLLNQLKLRGFIENKIGPALNTKPSNVNIYDKKIKHFPSIYHTSDEALVGEPKVEPIEYLEVRVYARHCDMIFGCKADKKYQQILGELLSDQLGLAQSSIPTTSDVTTSTSTSASPKSGF